MKCTCTFGDIRHGEDCPVSKEAKVSESPSVTGYAICNHIVGFFGNEDIAQIVRADSARGMKPRDYWKFCPECGEQIKQA